MSHAGRDVDGRLCRIDSIEKIRDGQLTAAVLADERRRDALLHLARGSWMLFQAAIGVAVDVDESWRDHAAVSFDHLFTGGGRQPGTNVDNRVARHAHVRPARSAAGTVDETSVSNEQCSRRLAFGGTVDETDDDQDWDNGHRPAHA